MDNVKQIQRDRLPMVYKIHRKFIAIENEYVQSLILAVLWQVIMTVFCFLIFSIIPPNDKDTLFIEGDFLFKYAAHLDGSWYIRIVQGAYLQTTGVFSFSPVFYPLFPLFLWIFSLGGTFDITLISLLINTVALSFAFYFLRKIQRELLPNISNEWLLIIAFMVAPAACFLNWIYTEAIFCAIVFAAYYFALKRNWALCTIFLAFSTATRFPAILFVGLCGLEYLKSTNWRIDKRILWFLLAPLGFLFYATYLYIVRDDFLLMFHAMEHWSIHQFNINIISTLYKEFIFICTQILQCRGFANNLLPFMMLLLLIWACVYLMRNKKFMPLAIFGIVCCIFFTLNSNVISVHRYLLPVLPIYIALLDLRYSKFKKNGLFKVIFVLSILSQIFITLNYIRGAFVG
jgi:hypothetical protein